MKLIIKLNDNGVKMVKELILAQIQKGRNFTQIKGGEGLRPIKTKWGYEAAPKKEVTSYIPSGGRSAVSLQGDTLTLEGARHSLRNSGCGPVYWAAKKLVEGGQAEVEHYRTSDRSLSPFQTTHDKFGEDLKVLLNKKREELVPGSPGYRVNVAAYGYDVVKKAYSLMS